MATPSGFRDDSPEHVPAWVVPVLRSTWGGTISAPTYEQPFLRIGAEGVPPRLPRRSARAPGVATVSREAELDLARVFAVTALPLAVVATPVFRWPLRAGLPPARNRRSHLQAAVLLGHRIGVTALEEQVAREKTHGHAVVRGSGAY